MSKRGIVYGKGVNDMPRGWRTANDWNYRVYRVWCSMIERCYSKKYLERQPTYIGCVVCERWLTLSNFVADVVKIDNYDYWLNHPNKRVSLDKDVKSNGQCKKYSIENCMFISASENTKQAVKTRDNTYLQGENNYWYGKNPLAGKTDEELVERSRKWHETMNNKSDEELAEISRKRSEAHKGKNPYAGKTDEELAEIRKKQSEAHKGEKNPRATLVDRFDKQGNYIDTKYQFEYVQMGFNAGNIYSCCKGRIKSHKGFIFKYHKE